MQLTARRDFVEDRVLQHPSVNLAKLETVSPSIGLMAIPQSAVMGNGRREAFRNGVLALITTIMVLETKMPIDAALLALRPLAPAFRAIC